MMTTPKILSVVLLCAGSIVGKLQYALAGPTECQVLLLNINRQCPTSPRPCRLTH